MNTPDNQPFFANSVLNIVASGNIDINNDLNSPNGKSIAQLIYDQEKTTNQENNETENGQN